MRNNKDFDPTSGRAIPHYVRDDAGGVAPYRLPLTAYRSRFS